MSSRAVCGAQEKHQLSKVWPRLCQWEQVAKKGEMAGPAGWVALGTCRHLDREMAACPALLRTRWHTSMPRKTAKRCQTVWFKIKLAQSANKVSQKSFSQLSVCELWHQTLLIHFIYTSTCIFSSSFSFLIF